MAVERRDRLVDCPHCGNAISVKLIRMPQKCQYCRRLLRVVASNSKAKKAAWSAEPVDSQENNR